MKVVKISAIVIVILAVVGFVGYYILSNSSGSRASTAGGCIPGVVCTLSSQCGTGGICAIQVGTTTGKCTCPLQQLTPTPAPITPIPQQTVQCSRVVCVANSPCVCTVALPPPPPTVTPQPTISIHPSPYISVTPYPAICVKAVPCQIDAQCGTQPPYTGACINNHCICNVLTQPTPTPKPSP